LPSAIFRGVVPPTEVFDLSICNPPFHASRAEALAGTRRKLTNLSGRDVAKAKTVLNFGGQDGELWCEGGELAFVRRMITESAQMPGICRWFTTLVSKVSNLPLIEQALQAVRPADVRVIAMAQGQKKSRIVAWRFDQA
jgi:23S rRNA (adenine1618-N6)-methyltransferase